MISRSKTWTMLLGIDLGTTFSATASLGPSGIPVLTPDRRDGKLFHTPSVVHLGAISLICGLPPHLFR